MEQLAGRRTLRDAGRNDRTLIGLEELQRRFGKKAVLSANWEYRYEDGGSDYWVDVLVQPADGSDVLCFTEPLSIFPSEECIAQLALVT